MIRNGQHAEQVGAWIDQSLKGLDNLEQVRVFEFVILLIQRRSLVTLSPVTFNAVLDRVLFESSEKYAFLSGIKVSANGFSFANMESEKIKALPTSQFSEAVRFFLVELFSILENLTAGVLTLPLYKELSEFSTAATSRRKDRGDA